jgi:hypothetical protein
VNFDRIIVVGSILAPDAPCSVSLWFSRAFYIIEFVGAGQTWTLYFEKRFGIPFGRIYLCVPGFRASSLVETLRPAAVLSESGDFRAY